MSEYFASLNAKNFLHLGLGKLLDSLTLVTHLTLELDTNAT